MKQKTKQKIETEEEIKHELSSGNVFADLDLPDAEELFLKGHLAVKLQRHIEDAGWKKREAARRLGLTATELSELLGGRLAEFGADRLRQLIERAS